VAGEEVEPLPILLFLLENIQGFEDGGIIMRLKTTRHKPLA
jgi:hypothetical protein